MTALKRAQIQPTARISSILSALITLD